VRESTKWRDVLLDSISFAHGVGGGATNDSSTDSVNLIVDVCSGVVTELTTTSDSPLNCRWMPGSDTTDLSDTSVRASLKACNSESLDDTLHSLTFCSANGVDALGHFEDLGDSNFLLEFLFGELDLVSNTASVKLDFHDVRLLLAKIELVKLGSADNADNRAVFGNAGEVSLVGLGIVFIAFEAVSVVLEGVLLGSVPVLVESTLNVTLDVASEDSGKSTESTRSLNVADDTDDSHWWTFND